MIFILLFLLFGSTESDCLNSVPKILSDQELKEGLRDLTVDDLKVLNKLVDMEKDMYDDYDVDRTSQEINEEFNDIDDSDSNYIYNPELYDTSNGESTWQKESLDNKDTKSYDYDINYETIQNAPFDMYKQIPQIPRTKREEPEFQTNEAYIQQLHESFPPDIDASDEDWMNTNNFPILKELIRVKRN
ncbi:uncharacterized protein [Musca autumnalis]|uniref:uncharacterized protein n=1 Tax=Musca autumnalis TaxID=221902 RepID=UPI003CE9880C